MNLSPPVEQPGAATRPGALIGVPDAADGRLAVPASDDPGAGAVYPMVPGHKADGTSAAAGQVAAESAGFLRDLCLYALGTEDMTADECAGRVGKSILSIRPRFSELLAMGEILDSGRTRRNNSGRMATVWTVRRFSQGELL